MGCGSMLSKYLEAGGRCVLQRRGHVPVVEGSHVDAFRGHVAPGPALARRVVVLETFEDVLDIELLVGFEVAWSWCHLLASVRTKALEDFLVLEDGGGGAAPYQSYSSSRREQCLFCYLLYPDMRSDELPVECRLQVAFKFKFEEPPARAGGSSLPLFEHHLSPPLLLISITPVL